MNSSSRATVVVVNYNGAHLLPPCLEALRRQDLPPTEFQTVVVDNASVDGSVELLRRDFPEVQVIASATNTGFAGGNNLALRDVRTPFAVLLNNDAVPEPDWLRRLLAAFEARGTDRVGVITGKVVFMPRFLPLHWETPGFSAGVHDPRDLGARVYRVTVSADGAAAGESGSADGASADGLGTDGLGTDGGGTEDEVTEKVLWERLTYGPEDTPAGRFRWTRPAGDLLVPLPGIHGATLDAPLTVTFTVAAEAVKPLTISGKEAGTNAEIGTEPTDVRLTIPAGTPLVDVVNNVGGIVLREGYGADRGFQEVDEGQYDEPAEVFTACGNGMAIRTEAGQAAGWFDDDFFMYYEDTDLSWRLRAAGWSIWYEPTAVLRHIHSASSKEWSPRWVFHVDRNRLLMLTKDARAGLAVRAALRYPLTSASMLLRAARQTARTRQRPALRPHLLRAKVYASYLRLLVPVLARRRAVRRSATVSRKELERWLVSAR